jgi:hypothetical protein
MSHEPKVPDSSDEITNQKGNLMRKHMNAAMCFPA